MASVSVTVSLLLLQIFSISSSVIGSSAPAVDCSTAILDLAGCLSFVMIGSKTEKPEGSCCSGLKKILATSPECLCEGLKNSDNLGIKLNLTKAYTLPQACNLKAPPVTACGLPTPAVAPAPIVVPVASPMAMRGPVSSHAPAPSPSQANLATASSFTSLSLFAAAFIILFSRF